MFPLRWPEKSRAAYWICKEEVRIQITGSVSTNFQNSAYDRIIIHIREVMPITE